MGRYLANGILTSVFIKKRDRYLFGVNENFDLKKEIKNILKDMDRIIDISKYDIIEKNDAFILNLKRDFLNENIHDLLIEISDLTPSVSLFTQLCKFDEAIQIDYNSPDFKKKYPLLCTIEDDYYVIKCNGKTVKEEHMFNTFEWIIDDDDLRENIMVRGAIISLWDDWNKYLGEDPTPMLRIINTMKTSHYHSKLSGALIYEIYG